ncbi:MAG: hypothetical protein ACI4A5_09025 [Hominilimicola sp.]
MKKIIIPNELVNIIAEQMIIDEHIKKAKKAIRKERISELTAQGIDKDIAAVMADCGL